MAAGDPRRRAQRVSRGDDADADASSRANKADFDLVASGRSNPMAAALRGALTLDGNPRLLIRVQRLFPAPVGMPESTGPRSMGKRRS